MRIIEEQHVKDQRVETDPDFVIAPKFNNSLKALLDRYPDGLPDAAAAKAMGISEEELSGLKNQALSRMRLYF